MSKKVFFISALALMMSNYSLAKPEEDSSKKRELLIKSENEEFSIGVHGQLNTGVSWMINKAPENNKFKFDLKTARLVFYGNAFSPKLKYFLQLKLNAGKVDEFLHDYYFKYAIKDDYVNIQVGKFNAPFLRQSLASSTLFSEDAGPVGQLIDKLPRSAGLKFFGHVSQFEWALAAQENGLTARAGYNYGHIDPYDLSDFDGGNIRFSVAGNYFLGTNYSKLDFDDMRAGLDFLVKFKGLASNGGFYYKKKKEDNEFGFSLDAGYLIHKKFEPMARYSWYKHEKHDTNEVLAGLNYYIFDRTLSLQGSGKYKVMGKLDNFDFAVEAKLVF